VVGVVVLALAGCDSGGSAHPVARASVRAEPTPVVSPSVPLPPPPSTGFSGPGTFALTWSSVRFTSATCPPNQPTATCFAGTASGRLPEIGDVALARTVVVGDGASPPPGCLAAVTDGTLRDPTGTLTFHGDGVLCGRTSAFTITRTSGTGSLAGYRILGQIINDTTSGPEPSGAVSASPTPVPSAKPSTDTSVTTEQWTGQVTPSS
jgi:hypothetical protein